AAMRSGVSRPMLARARPAARTRAWRNVGLSPWKRQSTNRTRRRHRDQPNLMAKLGQLTSQMICSTTCLRCDLATRLRCEKSGSFARPIVLLNTDAHLPREREKRAWQYPDQL